MITIATISFILIIIAGVLCFFVIENPKVYMIAISFFVLGFIGLVVAGLSDEPKLRIKIEVNPPTTIPEISAIVCLNVPKDSNLTSVGHKLDYNYGNWLIDNIKIGEAETEDAAVVLCGDPLLISTIKVGE